jgi:hypothetical protein
MSITEDIEAMCKTLKSNKVYYQTSPHIPKTDEAGQENFSKMKVDNVLEVWLMHPDLLPQFEQIVQNSGKNLEEFDLADYLNLPKRGLSNHFFFD